METKLMNFTKFIQTYYSWFVMDTQAHEIVKRFDYYARRSDMFEDGLPEHWVFEVDGVGLVQKQFFLEKGLLVIGNVGTGKTELFRILNSYNRYLKSPYEFKMDVAWRYADKFRKDGQDAFSGIGSHNMYFDELCLTDENGNPTKEHAQLYGNKILSGEEIIRIRSEVFKRKGFVTHFTTNVPLQDLHRIYGERAFSRLIEMCNVMLYVGNDRRLNARPRFLNNQNEPIFHETPATQEDFDKETKGYLDGKLLLFKTSRSEQQFSAFDYDALVRLDASPYDEKVFATTFYEAALKRRRLAITSPENTNGWKRVNLMHKEGKLDEGEQREVMIIAKHLAILTIADTLLKQDKTSFFK
jgi:hypothetical protein